MRKSRFTEEQHGSGGLLTCLNSFIIRFLIPLAKRPVFRLPQTMKERFGTLRRRQHLRTGEKRSDLYASGTQRDKGEHPCSKTTGLPLSSASC